MKNLRTIILAAGKGTRMKSDVPKVLHPVCGQPMIQYVLDIAKTAGSLKTYLVLGHKHEIVEKAVDQDVVSVVQKQQLGTADAVRCASRYFSSFRGDVLVMCGDTPLLNKQVIKRLVKHHKKSQAAATVLTAVLHNPNGYGRIIRGDQGVVMAIREEKDATEFEKNIAEINVGVYCFKSRDIFKALKSIQLNPKKKEFYLTDVIELMVEQGLPVQSVETDDPRDGLGVNSREDLSVVESVMRKRILSDLMESGVTIVDPSNTYVYHSVTIGRDTVIKPFTVIENNVKIGKQCVIGPFARLRPGTRIGDQVEVGNYTEVSRTQIGRKSLMKHFSFLGDARVGMNVNIGAGTVTANYDGENKNVTQIGNQAFIGSDSILVAPVKIGKNAKTGAGCVVVKGSVPDHGVVVGVPAKSLAASASKNHK
jgi:bifunctional UDP-N-acetylglucosamine pyrophosphorylase/glucosamine-1-phosphate N-acetyltransferase